MPIMSEIVLENILHHVNTQFNCKCIYFVGRLEAYETHTKIFMYKGGRVLFIFVSVHVLKY